MLKALLSNKKKLLELANTPLNENCLAVILMKLPEKLGDPRKFLISCGFSELKCKALADLGASINLMPLSFWKKLGLPELISTRMTLKLANQAICTLAGITRDVFVLVGKFTFPADFVIVDYESDPKVSLILGRPFLRTARALIDVHGQEIILYSILEDSINESNLADPNVNLFDTIPKMFTDKHALDYSSPSLYDNFDVDLDELESNNDDVYNDLFDYKEYKIKESKLLIYELDLPRSSDFLPSPRKEVLGSETLLLFSSENKEKNFKPEILTSKGVHTSLLPELSHRGSKAFKVFKICESPMKIFACSYGEDIRILDVPCLHFYPP
nr:reverse transcriptase domain-containing protein [Tanacetum cinerariifolium]